MLRFVGLIALCLLATPALAVQFRVLQVRYDGALSIDLQALVRAPAKRVGRLLSNYDGLARLVPIVTESRRMPGGPPGTQRVHTRVRGCVLFICASLVNVIDVTHEHEGAYRAVTVPALSDFKSGDVTWSYEPSGRYTLLRFHARLKPELWLPPLIGPFLIERKIRGQLIQGVRHLEEEARYGKLPKRARPRPAPPAWPFAKDHGR